MYPRVDQYLNLFSQSLFGLPVAASNPSNPFGTTVNVDVSLPSIRQEQVFHTDFSRYLVGAKGSFFDSWHWELAGWQSEDTTDNPQRNVNANYPAILSALSSSDPAIAL